jgi:hypothetical protein
VKDLARQLAIVEAKAHLPAAERAPIYDLDEHTADVKDDGPDRRRMRSKRWL